MCEEELKFVLRMRACQSVGMKNFRLRVKLVIGMIRFNY